MLSDHSVIRASKHEMSDRFRCFAAGLTGGRIDEQEDVEVSAKLDVSGDESEYDRDLGPS